jgi:epoxyqueuosine reductase QueG
MSTPTTNRESFESNPALFIERLIKDFTAQSPSNELKVTGGGRIFDEPLVGFADGDDSIFEDYKRIIGPHHFTPREALDLHLRSKNGGRYEPPSRLSVISIIMPASKQTRLDQRRETVVGSLRWNRTRWHGQDFMNELSRHIVSALEGLGRQAVAPELASFHKTDLKGFTSSWSQRHIAYAAGLGAFGLSDGLITPRGMAMRCASVVTDVAIPPTPRRFKDHHGACLFYVGEKCGRCIARCPAGAISEAGHDKKKCSDYLTYGREIVKQRGQEAEYIGHYPGCGLCQTKVPCEAGIPKAASAG